MYSAFCPTRKKNSTPSTYQLHGQILGTTKESKYLGVTINENLKWSSHINNIAAKGNSTVGFLRRNFKDCTTKVKAATYTTMVRPSLEYAATVWDPHEEKDKRPLEMVQRRAARYCFNSYYDRTPGVVTNMIRKLEWDSLEERRERNRLIMMYKIRNNLVGIDQNKYIRASDPRTRGAGIYQQQDFHRVIRNTFFPRTSSAWNTLPQQQHPPPLWSLSARDSVAVALYGHKWAPPDHPPNPVQSFNCPPT